MLKVMERNDLQAIAPSIFATEPASRTSEAYKMFPTIDVVDAFGKEGWRPVYAGQQRVRDANRAGYQKHIIRFRHETEIKNIVGGLQTEGFDIVLTNSHDGTSAYRLFAGVFRTVCINGLVVGTKAFQVSVVHMGNSPRDVYNASLGLSEKMPSLKDRIEAMRSKMLTTSRIADFAKDAYSLKWDLTPVKRMVYENGNDIEKESTVFHPNNLTAIRRDEDKISTLWNAFNVVQENMLKGMPFRIDTNHGRKEAVRPVRGINENLRLNTALWNLAESYL